MSCAGPWLLYLLRCGDGTLYCGITNDLPKRLAAHAAGKGARYTRGRGPLRLVYREACADRSAALRREHAVKQLSRAEKSRLVRAARAAKPANAARAKPPRSREPRSPAQRKAAPRAPRKALSTALRSRD